MNTLSMSFYDDSTIKKKKQIILDSCPIEDTHKIKTPKPRPTSRTNSKRSNKKVKAEIRIELSLEKEKDEIDFTTTEASKLNTN